MNRLKYKNALSALIALAAATTVTQSFAAGDWYIGGTISQAYVDERGLDYDDTGGKIYGGYRLNNNFAIEGSYYDFGEMSNGGNSLDIDGLSLGVVGSVPLSDTFSVFAKVGAHFWDADISGPIVGQFSDDSDTDLFYGVGVDYALNDQWSIRGEIERYEVDKFDLDVASVGITLNF
jgi:OOP family OmpA-OmpF porin